MEYPEALDERHRAGVLAAVNKCMIHNTLLHPPPKITVDVQVPASCRGVGWGEEGVTQNPKTRQPES